MRNFIIYSLILLSILILVGTIINGVQMNEKYSKPIVTPTSFLLFTAFVIWVIVKLAGLLKKKNDSN